MKFARIAFISTAALFICGIFYWAAFAPKEDVSQRIYKTLQEQEKRADLTFKNVTFEEVSNGIKYWQLDAKSAMVNKDTGMATLQEARGTFFKAGSPALKFICPAALWDMRKKEIYLDHPLGYDVALEKNISAIAASTRSGLRSVFNFPEIYTAGPGYWFQARNLSWKLADQKLFCSGGIELNKGEVTGYAEKLEGDINLEKISLRGNPRILVRVKKSFPVTIEAEGFEVLNTEDTVLANGSPRITWGRAKVESQKAKYLQKFKKLELNENVKLVYQDIFASGNSASYLTDSQQVILEGDAWAEQEENRLSGERVLVSLREQKISLLGKGKVIINEKEIK